MSSYHLLSILIFHLITFQTHALRPPQQPPRHNPNNPTTPVPASSVCQSTQYPTYCNKILHSDNTTTTAAATLYEYGRFSIKRSISQTAKFLRLINHYLHKRHRTLTPSAVGALQDCQLLANLNLDFLTTSFYSLKQNKTLHHNTSDDIQTYLSGTLTNQQTCIDGIKSAESAWSIDHDITKLFSISLSLFTKAWSPPSPPPNPKNPSSTHHGRLPRLHHRHRHGRLLGGGYNDDEDDMAVVIYDVVTVAQDGSGNFSSIMEAVNAAPDKNEANDGYFLIYVSEGVYEEYVDVDKKKRYIMMIGDGINKTIITGNRSVAHNFTTFHSATFVVTGTGFVGVNITIRNTAGAANHQAVALRSSSDLSAFYSCSFEGYQDTLYVHSLRQFYKECDIYGTVDFIFGNANVVFQNCNIYPRLPLENQFNAITAQGRTDPNQNTGISIENCVIRASDDLSKSNGTIKTYLGRPWKEYSRTVYMKSFIDNVVDSSGWREWNGNFALDTLYYGEYNNRGPSSNVSNRVNWGGYHVMNATDASNFTVASFVFGDNWLPQTGVPYASDLL